MIDAQRSRMVSTRKFIDEVLAKSEMSNSIARPVGSA